MRVLIIYLLMGTLFLAACGAPATSPQGENAPATMQPISTATATPVPTGQVPDEPIEATGEAVILLEMLWPAKER